MIVLYYLFQSLQMIDKFFYTVFGGLDRMCAAIAKFMEAKPKNKRKKK